MQIFEETLQLAYFQRKVLFRPGDRVYYWQIDKSKIKHGTTSGRWYKARILSQEGAICVIDTGSTVLRINQPKMRKAKFAGDTTDPRGSDVSATPTSSLPRERPDIPDDHPQDHPAPDVYWITPQHVTVDILELSNGRSIFSSICNLYGLRTGECLNLKGQFS